MKCFNPQKMEYASLLLQNRCSLREINIKLGEIFGSGMSHSVLLKLKKTSQNDKSLQFNSLPFSKKLAFGDTFNKNSLQTTDHLNTLQTQTQLLWLKNNQYEKEIEILKKEMALLKKRLPPSQESSGSPQGLSTIILDKETQTHILKGKIISFLSQGFSTLEELKVFLKNSCPKQDSTLIEILNELIVNGLVGKKEKINSYFLI